MRRFRFRLESVETLRQIREREALRLLAEAQRGLEQAKAQQAELYKRLSLALNDRDRTSEKLAEHAGASVSGLLQAMGDFVSGQKVRISQAEHGILRERRKVEKALRIYLLSKRQLRIIETLRDRDFEEFKKELRKRDAKISDETSAEQVTRAIIEAEEGASDHG